MTEDSKFDEAADAAMRLTDLGVGNAAEAWHGVDPNRNIRRDQQRRDNIAQQALNSAYIEEGRAADRAAALSKIDKISDPRQREKARDEYLARERVAALRRGQRAK